MYAYMYVPSYKIIYAIMVCFNSEYRNFSVTIFLTIFKVFQLTFHESAKCQDVIYDHNMYKTQF